METALIIVAAIVILPLAALGVYFLVALCYWIKGR